MGNVIIHDAAQQNPPALGAVVDETFVQRARREKRDAQAWQDHLQKESEASQQLAQQLHKMRVYESHKTRIRSMFTIARAAEVHEALFLRALKEVPPSPTETRWCVLTVRRGNSMYACSEGDVPLFTRGEIDFFVRDPLIDDVHSSRRKMRLALFFEDVIALFGPKYGIELYVEQFGGESDADPKGCCVNAREVPRQARS